MYSQQETNPHFQPHFLQLPDQRPRRPRTTPPVPAHFHGHDVSPTSHSPDSRFPPAYDTRHDVPPVPPQRPRRSRTAAPVLVPFHGQNVIPTSQSPDPLLPPEYNARHDVLPVPPQQPRPIINTKPRNQGKGSDEIPGRQVHFGGRDHDGYPSQHPQHSSEQPHRRPSSLREITGRETRPLAWLIAVFCALFWIIIIVVGLTVLIIFLVYRPRLPKFDISTATLNAAYLDMGYLLNADFTILANFTNPNTKVNVDFRYAILDLYYENKLISTRYIEPFTAFRSVSTFQTVHMVTSQVRLPFSTTQDLTRQINEGRVEFEVKGLFRTRSILGGLLKYSYWLYSHCTITVAGPPTGVLVSKRCTTKR